MTSFFDFPFDDRVLDGLDAMGFETPTPIQEQTIPITLAGRDLIACAQTGTGKTAAYLLPVMHHILQQGDRNHISALIISPTRELALQIDQALTGFAYFCGISNIAVYGGGSGESFDREKKAFISGADIVVATPGRLLAHINLGYVDFSKVEHLILDEADRMLDMGFYDDIMRIVAVLPKERQTLMFSATMPSRIRQLAAGILRNPEQISISISKPAAGIRQIAYLTYDQQKLPLLQQILNNDELISVIVFSSTKQKVKEIDRELQRMKLSCAAIHSDLEQNEREEVLRRFRNRNLKVLVATDVLSRGIDIENISMVVNYDVPGDAEDYVHRVGRTARAESTGTAITFINPADMRRFGGIEALIGYEIEKAQLPEGFEPGPTYNPQSREGGHDRRGRGGKKSGGHKKGGGHAHHHGGKEGGGQKRPKFNKRRRKGGNNDGGQQHRPAPPSA